MCGTRKKILSLHESAIYTFTFQELVKVFSWGMFLAKQTFYYHVYGRHELIEFVIAFLKVCYRWRFLTNDSRLWKAKIASLGKYYGIIFNTVV